MLMLRKKAYLQVYIIEKLFIAAFRSCERTFSMYNLAIVEKNGYLIG